MLITKREEVTKQGFCKILWRKLRPRGSLLLVLIQFLGGVRGKGVGWGGCLFEAGCLLTFSAFRMGAYSRWVLIRGWALIRVNTVSQTEINFWFSRSAKQCQNPCSGPPPVYQDLSTCHDWPVNKAIVNLPIRLKGNSKRISSSVSWVLWGPRTRAVDTGDYEDLTETGNCVRKVSGTQGKSLWKSDAFSHTCTFQGIWLLSGLCELLKTEI